MDISFPCTKTITDNLYFVRECYNYVIIANEPCVIKYLYEGEICIKAGYGLGEREIYLIGRFGMYR